MATPIERMIDKACGVTPQVLSQMQSNKPSLENETNALLALADAAKAWHLDPNQEQNADALHVACAEWVALGG